MTAYIAFPSGIIVNEDEVILEIARHIRSQIMRERHFALWQTIEHDSERVTKSRSRILAKCQQDRMTTLLMMEVKYATRH